MQPDAPPAPTPTQGDATRTELPPSADAKSVIALVLGILCVVGTACGLGLLLGVPAIILGALAHRDIRRGGGLSPGRGLATAGMALGFVGSLLFFGWIALVLLFVFTPEPMAVPSPPAIGDPPGATWSAAGPGVVPEDGLQGSTIELHRAGGPLRAQLAKQASVAHAAGETVLVETTALGCDSCDEVAHAILDPRTQAALSKVRLVDVDVGEFHSELGRLRMDESTAPWFYLLDARGEPRDAISADEWDDNDAVEIAPILRAFTRGRLHARRHGWHGGATL